MARADPTWTQTIIFIVAATVPLVHAFTHHRHHRELALALWLPLVWFVGLLVYPSIGRWPEDAPLEVRLRFATIYLLVNPLTYLWPLFFFSVMFWRRRRERRSSRTDSAPIEAMSQGARWGGPLALLGVVPLVVLMLVVAQYADQTGA